MLVFHRVIWLFLAATLPPPTLTTAATCWAFKPPAVVAAVGYKMTPDGFVDIYTYRGGALYSTSLGALGHGTNAVIVRSGEVVESVFVVDGVEIKRVRVTC
jgi:hypothetical protein